MTGEILKKYYDLKSVNSLLEKENQRLQTIINELQDKMINWTHGNLPPERSAPDRKCQILT